MGVGLGAKGVRVGDSGVGVANSGSMLHDAVPRITTIATSDALRNRKGPLCTIFSCHNEVSRTATPFPQGFGSHGGITSIISLPRLLVKNERGCFFL